MRPGGKRQRPSDPRNRSPRASFARNKKPDGAAQGSAAPVKLRFPQPRPARGPGKRSSRRAKASLGPARRGRARSAAEEDAPNMAAPPRFPAARGNSPVTWRKRSPSVSRAGRADSCSPSRSMAAGALPGPAASASSLRLPALRLPARPHVYILGAWLRLSGQSRKSGRGQGAGRAPGHLGTG